jgi:hypothetical protein
MPFQSITLSRSQLFCGGGLLGLLLLGVIAVLLTNNNKGAEIDGGVVSNHESLPYQTEVQEVNPLTASGGLGFETPATFVEDPTVRGGFAGTISFPTERQPMVSFSDIQTGEYCKVTQVRPGQVSGDRFKVVTSDGVSLKVRPIQAEVAGTVQGYNVYQVTSFLDDYLIALVGIEVQGEVFFPIMPQWAETFECQ